MTRDPLDVLTAAMLAAAEREDADGLAALKRLAADPQALAEWLATLPPELLAAGD